MSHIHTLYHTTPIGEMIIGTYHDQLCLLDFRYRKMRQTVDNRLKNQLNTDFLSVAKVNNLQHEVIQQLTDYFNGSRTHFNLPILLVGSHFQKQVWQALQQLPYGKTCSYLELANRIHQPKAVRAVANANGANALAIIVPCHRVIANNGELGGYGGGLPAKQKLLNLEKTQAFFN